MSYLQYNSSGDKKMKMNRLFEITIILLNKGSVTAKELAGRFGVSTRTIYRDIDVLSAAGVHKQGQWRGHTPPGKLCNKQGADFRAGKRELVAGH